jgi:hypothetical protein
MDDRPPHGSPDIEAALTWLAEQADFEIKILREDAVYCRLRYLEDDPNGASRDVYEAPRNTRSYARDIVKWAEKYLSPQTISTSDAGDSTDDPDTIDPS